MKTIIAIAALALSATAAGASGLVPGSDTSERAADARSVVAVATGAYGEGTATAAGTAGGRGTGSLVPGIDADR